MADRARVGYARKMARNLLAEREIDTPPTPIRNLVEAEGFAITMRDNWPDSVSALVLPGERVMGVNAEHHRHRQRLSMAHELGHFVLDHANIYPADVSLDNPPTGSLPKNDPREREAFEFGGELLMPLAWLKERLEGTTDVAALAREFDVSESALFVRLDRQRLLPKL